MHKRLYYYRISSKLYGGGYVYHTKAESIADAKINFYANKHTNNEIDYVTRCYKSDYDKSENKI